MKRSYLAGALLILSMVVGTGWGGPLDAVAPYVGGEWRINAAWKDGNPLQARSTYEWGVGKKFIIAKTFVGEPTKQYQRYVTIFGEQDGKLMAWGFVFDGHHDVSEFKIDGKRLHSDKPMPAADGSKKSILHQSIELTEPNRMHWLVSIETNGQDKPVMDGEWVRSTEVTKDAKLVWPKVEATADDKLLEPIASLIGNWKIDTKWSDGKPLHATKTFEWGPGKKFVVAKTTVLKEDGSLDYERYYTLFGVDDGKLMQFNFVHDGNTDFAPQTIDGKRIGGVRTFKYDGAETKVNQYIELTDPNTLHWRVWNDRDGVDKPMMDADWKRVAE
jgi:hypothetical protein